MVKRKAKKKTNSELKAELARLRKTKALRDKKVLAQRKVLIARRKKEYLKRIENAKLKKELADLKNPKSAVFKKNVRSGLKKSGKGAVKGAKAFWDAL